MSAILDFSKKLYLSLFMSYRALIKNLSYLHLNVIATYFDSKLSLFGLVFSAYEEEPKAPRRIQRALETQRLPTLYMK